MDRRSFSPDEMYRRYGNISLDEVLRIYKEARNLFYKPPTNKINIMTAKKIKRTAKKRLSSGSKVKDSESTGKKRGGRKLR